MENGGKSAFLRNPIFIPASGPKIKNLSCSKSVIVALFCVQVPGGAEGLGEL